MTYCLSPLGESLLKPLAELIRWAERNHRQIQSTRERFDGTTSSSSFGEEACGEPGAEALSMGLDR